MTSLWLPWRFVRVFPTIRCYGTNWLHQIPNPFFIEGNGIVKDLICYCFDYTVDDITQDYLANGKSTIMDKIQIEKKFGNCRCATKNPKGKWCLGDVRQVVDKLKGNSSFGVINWNVEDWKVFGMRNEIKLTNIVALESSPESLKERFNGDCEKTRLLALLSPTCYILKLL